MHLSRSWQLFLCLAFTQLQQCSLQPLWFQVTNLQISPIVILLNTCSVVVFDRWWHCLFFNDECRQSLYSRTSWRLCKHNSNIKQMGKATLITLKNLWRNKELAMHFIFIFPAQLYCSFHLYSPLCWPSLAFIQYILQELEPEQIIPQFFIVWNQKNRPT